MLLPYICDVSARETNNTGTTRKQIHQPHAKPKEMDCHFSFKSDYDFLCNICCITMAMEKREPGSSSLTMLENKIFYTPGPLPVRENDNYTEQIVREYVCREIYHSCKLDEERSGPFCFIHNVVQYVREVMESVTETDSERNKKQKIYDFLKSVIPENELAECKWLPSKHVDSKKKKKKKTSSVSEQECKDGELFQYPNSHLVYSKRWISHIIGFLDTNQKIKTKRYTDFTNLQKLLSSKVLFETIINASSDFEYEDEEENDEDDSMSVTSSDTTTSKKSKKKQSRDFKEFRKGRATALSAILRMHNSYSVRFQSWWITASTKIANVPIMLQTLSDSLRHVFGFKTSFRPGFKLNTNYRFETKTPVLSRFILNTVRDITGKQQPCPMEKICADHKNYLNTLYKTTPVVKIFDNFFKGCSQIILMVQTDTSDRKGKRQAVAGGKKRKGEDCLRIMKKFKMSETTGLNSMVFGDHITVEEEEEEEEDDTPSTSAFCKNELTADVIVVEYAETSSQSVTPQELSLDDQKPFIQIDCDRQTTSAMLEDDTVVDSVLDDQTDFMNDQSLEAIQMLQNSPKNFNEFFANLTSQIL